MAGKERRGDHQKLKMLYLAKIFSEETDDQHALTMAEIIEKLSRCGVNADRKTLYLDFDELRDFGMDIIAEQVSDSPEIRITDFEMDAYDLLCLVGKKRGMVIRGGETDTERAAAMLLEEFRNCKIGRISLERVEENA